MVRMIMHGCGGAMGQVITGLAAEDDSIEIVAGSVCSLLKILHFWAVGLCRDLRGRPCF